MKKLSKVIALMLSMLMAISSFPISALADEMVKEDASGSYNGFYWNYTAETDTLYINTNELAEVNAYDNPDTSGVEKLLPLTYTDEENEVKLWNKSFTKLVIGNKITSLSNIILGYDTKVRCFNYDFSQIEFEENSSLTEFSSYMLYKVPITNITIPNSVKIIGSYALSATNIKSVVIPSNVEILNNYAFSDNKHLLSAKFHGEQTLINTGCFSGCSRLIDVTLPSKIGRIPESAFVSCSALSNMEIPNSVEAIGNSAFKGTGLCNLVFTQDSSLTTIGSNAFEGSNIRSFVVPKNVTTIGSNAFKSSTLMSFDYGDSKVTQINYSTFKDCNMLETVNAKNIVSVGGSAFENDSKLANTTFGSVRTVGSWAFANSGIKEFSYSNLSAGNITATVSESAFRNCKSLSKVTLPQNLLIIGEYAFYGCLSLRKITIPSSVTEIQARAFNNTQLSTIIIRGNTTKIISSAFSEDTDDLKLVIYGTEDSKAKTFAQNRGYTFRLIDETTDEDTMPSEEEYQYNKYHGVWENGTWEIKNKSLYIIGSGDMTSNEAYDANGDLHTFAEIIRDNVRYIISFDNRITSVPDHFAYEQGEDHIVAGTLLLPTSAKSIGDYAFYNCDIYNIYANVGLFTSLNLSGYNYIPFDVQEIGDYAFANNAAANVNMFLPKDCRTIGEGAFYNTQFSTVVGFGFLKTIGPKAFANCKSLTALSLPFSVDFYEDDNNPANNSFGYNDDGTINAGLAFETRTNNSKLHRYALSKGFEVQESKGNCYSNGFIKSYYTEKKIITTRNVDCNLRWYYYPEDNSLDIISGNNPSSPGRLTDYYIDRIDTGSDNGEVKVQEDNFLNDLFYRGMLSLNSNPTDIGAGYLTVDRIVIDEGITGISATDLFSIFNPKEIVFPSTFTELNYDVFANCQRLERISIPESITSLHTNAFKDCKNLVAVDLGGVTDVEDEMFKGCKELTAVKMDNVKTIGDNAFANNVKLQQINLPSAEFIGSNAFYNCVSVQDINLGSEIKSLGEKAFFFLPYCEKITTNSNITSDSDVFRDIGIGTTGVDLELGDTITDVNFSAFYNCNIIKTKLGKNIQNISGMQWLPDMKTLELDPENTTFELSDNTLYKGTTLVYAPAGNVGLEVRYGTTDIGPYACSNSRMNYITLPNTVQVISDGAFMNCKRIKTINIAKGIKAIGNSAFENCINLRIFYSPSTITHLGDRAFKGCLGLESVILPAKLETIGDEAFMSCDKLQVVVLDEKVEAVGNRAFADCKSLENIYAWYGTSFGSNVFDGSKNVTINTMLGSDAYRYAREFGVKYRTYTDEDVFYDICAEKIDVYAGYLEYCHDGHSDILWLTVYGADCENDGYIIGVCDYCSELLYEKHVKAKGHNFKMITQIAPTDNTAGLKVYYCNSCKNSYSEYAPATSPNGEVGIYKVECKVTVATDISATKSIGPVKNVSVVIDDEVVATTDENGRFILNLATGVYKAELRFAYGLTRTIYIIVEDGDIYGKTIPIIACDFNKDGMIDDNDIKLFNYVVSACFDDPSYLDFVDLNNDGYINAKDMVYVLGCKGATSDVTLYEDFFVQR